MFFFEHESDESDELFRLRPGMYSWNSGDLWSTEFNSYANMVFSNTNRTNLTNLVGCDPVCIRGIREICGQLIIREYVFFEHESHESDESCRLRHGIYSWDSGDSWSTDQFGSKDTSF